MRAQHRRFGAIGSGNASSASIPGGFGVAQTPAETKCCSLALITRLSVFVRACCRVLQTGAPRGNRYGRKASTRQSCSGGAGLLECAGLGGLLAADVDPALPT